MSGQKRIDDYANISKEAREAAMRTCWPPVNVRDIYAFGYQDGLDSQSQLIKEKEKKIEELEKKLGDEQDDCLQVISERDMREGQVDQIANALGDETDWSNINDRGENAIELSLQLMDDLKEKDSEIARLREAIANATNAWCIKPECQCFLCEALAKGDTNG